MNIVEGLLAEKRTVTSELNSASDLADTVINTTGVSGKDVIKTQVAEVQQAVSNHRSNSKIMFEVQCLSPQVEGLFDRIGKLERELHSKLNKWEDFEESSSAFARWLSDIQEQLKGDIILKTTLDEKKSQLQVRRISQIKSNSVHQLQSFQIYRNILQDIKSQKPVLDDLVERVQKLPEKSDKIATFLTTSRSTFDDVLKRAQV